MNKVMKLSIKKLKKKIRDLKKTEYGAFWQKGKIVNFEWYETLFLRTPIIHEDFIRFLNERRTEIKSVLEIGCGAGIYPIKYKHLFDGIDYTGIDIGQPAIDFCKKHSSFNFICGDFVTMEHRTYDMIFTHAVIDHVYDINSFVLKIVKLANRYAYISAYRGYFPEMEAHKMRWNNDDGCYYNDISVPEIRELLLECGLTEGEFKVRKQESGMNLSESYADGLDGFETIIEISRK